jgi:phosphoglycolate phosphatase-like HAD superfamily hydrolase
VRRLIGRAIDSDEAARIQPLYLRFRAHYADCCLTPPSCTTACARARRDRTALHARDPQQQAADLLDRIADGLAISPLFATIVGGDALAVSKPDPATIGHVVRSVGGAGTVWMVGDSPIDVETGRRFGARTVACAWGLRERDELVAAAPDFLIERANELPALLARGTTDHADSGSV